MTINQGGSYDPETLTLLNTILDDAWASLLPDQQANLSYSKTILAERILRLARQGERDPIRLRACALMGVVASTRVES